MSRFARVFMHAPRAHAKLAKFSSSTSPAFGSILSTIFTKIGDKAPEKKVESVSISFNSATFKTYQPTAAYKQPK
jgi:hypothetical protein